MVISNVDINLNGYLNSNVGAHIFNYRDKRIRSNMKEIYTCLYEMVSETRGVPALWNCSNVPVYTYGLDTLNLFN